MNYGGALYVLAKEENLCPELQRELETLGESFRAEPEFETLLSAHTLSKTQRCQILDACFQGELHPYVLNFLKILVEKGYIRFFRDCCEAYTARYYEDSGILPVTAVTAVPLTTAQEQTLKAKLQSITGKQILLTGKLDPRVLGGIRLDYSGLRLDDTIAHRLERLKTMLANTVL